MANYWAFQRATSEEIEYGRLQPSSFPLFLEELTPEEDLEDDSPPPAELENIRTQQALEECEMNHCVRVLFQHESSEDEPLENGSCLALVKLKKTEGLPWPEQTSIVHTKGLNNHNNDDYHKSSPKHSLPSTRIEDGPASESWSLFSSSSDRSREKEKVRFSSKVKTNSCNQLVGVQDLVNTTLPSIVKYSLQNKRKVGSLNAMSLSFQPDEPDRDLTGTCAKGAPPVISTSLSQAQLQARKKLSSDIVKDNQDLEEIPRQRRKLSSLVVDPTSQLLSLLSNRINSLISEEGAPGSRDRPTPGTTGCAN